MSGSQGQNSPKTTGYPDPKGEVSRAECGWDQDSIPAKMKQGLVTNYNTRVQHPRLAGDLTGASLPSPPDTLADDSVEALYALDSLKPGEEEPQANRRVSIPNEGHATPGRTGDIPTGAWASDEVRARVLETGVVQCVRVRGLGIFMFLFDSSFPNTPVYQ